MSEMIKICKEMLDLMEYSSDDACKVVYAENIIHQLMGFAKNKRVSQEDFEIAEKVVAAGAIQKSLPFFERVMSENCFQNSKKISSSSISTTEELDELWARYGLLCERVKRRKE